MEIRTVWMTFGLAYALAAGFHGAFAAALYRLLYGRPIDPIPVVLFIVSGAAAGVAMVMMIWFVSQRSTD